MENCDGCTILKGGTRCVCVIIEYEMCASGKLIDLYVCIVAAFPGLPNRLGQPENSNCRTKVMQFNAKCISPRSARICGFGA